MVEIGAPGIQWRRTTVDGAVALGLQACVALSVVLAPGAVRVSHLPVALA
jgi:hypothetical protein